MPGKLGPQLAMICVDEKKNIVDSDQLALSESFELFKRILIQVTLTLHLLDPIW